MPSSAEKSRERVKRWRKENPEKYKEQRKRYRAKNAKVIYEKLKKWRKENPDIYKAQKEREKSARRNITKKDLQSSHETEVLPIINFDCDEVIALEQQQQDLQDLYAVIEAEQVVADFDLSLLDV